ncbi:MAG: hypothetical protein ACLP8A_06825 [Methylovirgula sp.]
MSGNIIAAVAGLCLLIALIESWLLVAVFSAENGPVAKLIPGGKDLLRSHIDYLMMAQFLFIFYGLLRLMQLTLPAPIVIALCFGAFFNPFAFLVRALRPAYLKTPPKAFTGFVTLSCIATTFGYLATAWIIVRAAFT